MDELSTKLKNDLLQDITRVKYPEFVLRVALVPGFEITEVKLATLYCERVRFTMANYDLFGNQVIEFVNSTARDIEMEFEESKSGLESYLTFDLLPTRANYAFLKFNKFALTERQMGLIHLSFIG